MGALLFMQDTAAAATPPGADAGGSYALFLIETLLILAGVCVAAWLVIRFGLRRLYAVPGDLGQRGPLRVLARLPLEPRRTLYVVEAGGKTLLIGAGDSGAPSVLAELDGDTVRAMIAKQPVPRSFLEILNLKRKQASAPPPSDV